MIVSCGVTFGMRMDPQTVVAKRPCAIRLVYSYGRQKYRPSFQWRHNERDNVLNHQPHDCLLNRLFRRRSKKISKLGVTGLCAGNSPGTGEFPAQMASYAENVSNWWRHHVPGQLMDSRHSPIIRIKHNISIFSLASYCWLTRCIIYHLFLEIRYKNYITLHQVLYEYIEHSL